jgi:hypothetical protein
MKTKISISVLLMILIASFLTVMGQEKTDKKKQEEETLKKKEQAAIVIDTKKDVQMELQKAMQESLAAEEQSLKAKQKAGVIDNKEFIREAEALQDYRKKMEQYKSQGDFYPPALNYVAPQIRWKMDGDGHTNIYSLYGDRGENTSLSISKTLEDVTFSTDFYYDVKAESSSVIFYVNGTVKAGELKITLKKPDKTAFQEITISPLADVNWNQKFSWDEDKADGYLGKWIISISAAKANGNYRVQVNSR